VLKCGRNMPTATKALLPPCRQQLLGSVLWQAAGDALGFLVEGRSAEECATYTKEIVRTGEVINYGLLRNVPVDTPGYVALADAPPEDLFAAFGQYTDDTQLMRELLKSLACSKGRLDCGDFAQRVAQLFQAAGLLKLHPALPGRHGIVGCGSSTRDAAQRIADGDAEAWHTSGRDSPGNGGCMRAGPLGVLFFSSDDGTVATVAALQAHATHARLEVKAAAAALVAAVRLAAGSGMQDPPTGIEPPQFCSAVAAVARVIHPGVAAACEALPEALGLPADQRRAWVVQRGVQCRDDVWSDGGVISSSAVQAVLWALASFLQHVDSPMECLCAAIEGGGDADTTAAMAGVVSGAR
jgi:ADP-ribosylglycohydrolase